MNGDKGFTYPAALMLIVIVSFAAMAAHTQWQTTVKRDKEKELLFRGKQILSAVTSYYQQSPGGSQQYPNSFGVLLKDNRFPAAKRHLRKIYKDPMTKDGNWGIVYDGRGNIKGVFSKSKEAPLKTKGFAKGFESFENKTHYTDWKFVHAPGKDTSQ
jgi:type II secretory pathway pseudopilin PulG